MPPSDPPVFYVCLGQARSYVAPPHIAVPLDGRLGTTDAVRDMYIAWLGAANIAGAGAQWWAHTSTAKNFLSSPLANDVVETLALVRILAADESRELFVVGASSAQIGAIRAWARQTKPGLKIIDRRGMLPGRPQLAIVRLGLQMLRMALWWLFRRPAVCPPADIYLFTYADSGFRDGNDAFFGNLSTRLESLLPGASVLHLAHAQGPYARIVPMLEGSRTHRYQLLLAELRLADIGTAFICALRALWRSRACSLPRVSGLDADALLRRAFTWDVAQGGYFLNVLIYCAAKRWAQRCRPARLIYPYENKSLEKMLLLGLREAGVTCRVIGYQHTSVTPRHATLMFAPGEAAATPLPDRILTTGRITLDYLRRLGRYPEGLLAEGCALRQRASAGPRKRMQRGGDPRLLVALSSSRFELESVVRFLMAFRRELPACDIGIRPHPEFPLAKLPPALSAWVTSHAADLSGTTLTDNLDWCDVAAYVSSTVAMEALLAGRPAIHIAIGDYLDPDPVIDGPRLHRRTRSVRAFIGALTELMTTDEAAMAVLAQEAIDYASEYFLPATDARVRAFLA